MQVPVNFLRWLYLKLKYGITNDIHPTTKIGKNVTIRNFVYIGPDVEIGDDCRIGNYVTINKGSKLGKKCNLQNYAHLTDDTKLGDNVFLGAYVVFADEKYPSVGQQVRKPCTLGNNVIMGTHSVLVASDIGDWSVLGSNSESFKDIPPNEVWKGVPAKFVTSRGEYDQKKSKWEELAQ